MSSSAITTGRWRPPWRSRFCCCSQAPSRSISTTTCGSWRPEGDGGTALLRRAAVGVFLRHRAAVPADPGADRLLVQRLAAGERLGRLFHRLVWPAPAQPPAVAGGAAVPGGGGYGLDRGGASRDPGGDRAGAFCALSRADAADRDGERTAG